MLTTNTVLQARYRIVRQLGQGGMGTVYEAIDERLNTVVALKETSFTDERLRKQFEREAHLLARLRHPAMTRVIDHFNETGGQFLVMDFISGEDLSQLLQYRRAPFSSPEVIEWTRQLLEVLAYLHAQNPPVVHRDIKPQNLKVAARNQIILLDFGLAKGFAGQNSQITPSGSIFGFTPNYAPIEQIQGVGTDPRSDLYSLGATLYHLATNVTPADVLSRAAAVIGGQADPLLPANEVNPEVPVGFAAILSRALRINRDQRFASAEEMGAALSEAMQPRHPGSNAKTLLDKADTAPEGASQGNEQRPADPPAAHEVAPPTPKQEPKPLPGPAVTPLPAPSEGSDHAPESSPTGRRPMTPYWITASLAVLLVAAVIVGIVVTLFGIRVYRSGIRGSFSPANKLLPMHTLAHGNIVWSVSFSPDGQTVASASGDGSVGLWDVATGKMRKQWRSCCGSMNAVTFSRNGRTLATGSSDGHVEMWDANTGARTWYHESRNGVVKSLSTSANGKLLAVASGRGFHSVEMLGNDTGEALSQRATPGFLQRPSGVQSIDFSPSQEILAFTEGSDALTDAAFGIRAYVYSGESSWILSAKFSPDGKMLATGSDSGAILLWGIEWNNSRDWVVVKNRLVGASGCVYSVAYSPNGKYLAAGGGDDKVRIWDLKTRAEVRTLAGHMGDVFAVAFSPNGKTLASASQDTTVRLWDVSDLN